MDTSTKKVKVDDIAFLRMFLDLITMVPSMVRAGADRIRPLDPWHTLRTGDPDKQLATEFGKKSHTFIPIEGKLSDQISGSESVSPICHENAWTQLEDSTRKTPEEYSNSKAAIDAQK